MWKLRPRRKPSLRPPQKTDGRRRAAILVLTLWMVVILGMISSSMLEEVYLELRLARFQREDFEALALARAGLARAVADLRNDLLMDRSGRNEAFDALGDVWARGDEGKLGRDGKGIELGHGTYRVWIEDDMSKFDLNAIALNPNVLRALFAQLGLNDKDADEVMRSVIDYRDQGNDSMPPGTGKEDEYYSALVDKKERKERRSRDEPLSYHCKNDRFSSVEELLSVYGITPKMFYGVDPEKEPLPNPIERLKARGERHRERPTRDQKTALRDVLTVHSNAVVNINTVDRFVLTVIFRAAGMDPKVAETVADNVVQLRKQDTQGNYSNDKVFRNVGELAQVAGMPPNLLARAMSVVQMSVRSDVYCVYALGEVGNSQHLICAHVARAPEVCQPEYLAPYMDRGAINRRLVDAFRRRHGGDRNQIETPVVRVLQWQEL